MNKFVLPVFFLGALFCFHSVVAQNPNTRTITESGKNQNSTSSVSVDRQIKKGDTQLNRANNSYQKAQSIGRDATVNNSRPSTPPNRTSSTTPNKTNSSTNPSVNGSSAVAKPSQSVSSTRPSQVNTNTMQKPSSQTLQRGANNANVTSRPAGRVESTQNPVRQTTSSTDAAPTATSDMRRGYNNQGVARPQPAAKEGRSAQLPEIQGKANPKFGPAPYVSHNHHCFGEHYQVPPRVRPVYYGGVPYYFYNSRFCRMINGYYVICRPPLGAVIAYSLFHTWRPVIVIYNNRSYYYDDGTFYLPRNRDYVVVAPPVGALIAELPSRYETIILEGRVYYKVDNVYYKEVVVNGYYWYEVLFVS